MLKFTHFKNEKDKKIKIKLAKVKKTTKLDEVRALYCQAAYNIKIKEVFVSIKQNLERVWVKLSQQIRGGGVHFKNRDLEEVNVIPPKKTWLFYVCYFNKNFLLEFYL